MSDGTLTRVKARFHVALHPALIDNADAGVHELLNTLLLRYSEDLGGIVLAYGNVRVLARPAPVHPYFPYVHVEVGATVTLFNPRPGCRLVGVVNKVGRDFIGLLVAGVVNVSIGAEAIRAELASAPGQGSWVSSRDPRHVISVSTTVAFDVLEVARNGQFVSLTGSLKEAGTGSVQVVGFPDPAQQRGTAAAGAGNGATEHTPSCKKAFKRKRSHVVVEVGTSKSIFKERKPKKRAKEP